jgi:hypothetical protein
MRNPLSYVLRSAAAGLLVGVLFVLVGQTVSSQGPQRTGRRTQGSAGEVPRTEDGKPDFSGIWQANSDAYWDVLAHDARPMVAQPGVYKDVPVLAAPVVALGTAGWIPASLGVVEGNEIPYQTWAAARQKENLANWLDRDPELRCYYPGVPRAMYLPYKFQIIQSTSKVMMAFEFRNAERMIHLDEVVPYPGDAFMGHSVGRWQGDTLIVDVTRFTDNTWFDRAGNFHSDALHVTERYTPLGRNAIQYEARMEDPKVFTRPWTIRLPLYRHLEANAAILPFRCMEAVEETFLGHLRKTPLVTRWEGKTMTVTVSRKVPNEEQLYEKFISGNPPD